MAYSPSELQRIYRRRAQYRSSRGGAMPAQEIDASYQAYTGSPSSSAGAQSITEDTVAQPTAAAVTTRSLPTHTGGSTAQRGSPSSARGRGNAEVDAGTAGSVLGGIAGFALAGPIGSYAGSLLGGWAGEPPTSAEDALGDVVGKAIGTVGGMVGSSVTGGSMLGGLLGGEAGAVVGDELNALITPVQIPSHTRLGAHVAMAELSGTPSVGSLANTAKTGALSLSGSMRASTPATEPGSLASNSEGLSLSGGRRGASTQGTAGSLTGARGLSLGGYTTVNPDVKAPVAGTGTGGPSSGGYGFGDRTGPSGGGWGYGDGYGPGNGMGLGGVGGQQGGGRSGARGGGSNGSSGGGK